MSDTFDKHLIGGIRGAATYIVQSGVPELERRSRLIGYFKEYLFPRPIIASDLSALVEKFRADAPRGLRETSALMHDFGMSKEDHRREMIGFEANMLAFSALSGLLEECAGYSSESVTH